MKKIIITLILFIAYVPVFCQALPNVKLIDVENNIFQTNNFNINNDKPIVLSFWATWCIPCINELTTINDYLDDWKKNNSFDFYAISIDDSRAVKRVQPLVNGKGWNFKVLLDVNQDFKRTLNLPSIPYTLIVKNGKIIYKSVGYIEGDEFEILKIIKDNQ